MSKLLLHNAKVYVDKGIYEEAVLIDGGRIAKVGKNDEVLAFACDGTQVIDCAGKTLIPGLNDTHLHFFQFGETLNQAPIEGVKSIDEMVEICLKFAEEHPETAANGIHALGWNQDLFTSGEKRIPDRHDLDRISTEYPVMLERICGHINSCNTKMLETAGITADTPQPEGGEFEIGDDGIPNGIFKESATKMVDYVIPGFETEDYRRLIQDAQKYALAHGLTTVQSNDIGSTSFENLDEGFALIKDMLAKDELKIRYTSQTCFKTADDLKNFLEKSDLWTADYGEDPLFQPGSVKMFRDGSLGGRTALLKNGYVPDRDNHGLEWHSIEQVRDYVKLANERGIPVVVHVIGDEAVDSVMQAFIEADPTGTNPCRNALIHCQITDNEILDRIVEHNIYVYAQPIFIDYDMKIVEPLCGPELAESSYAFGTLLRRGVHLSYGTDCPVESCNPFRNLYTAVTRKAVDGTPCGGWYAKECVDRETAIDAYTVQSAYAEFLEDRKGRIKEGYYADLALLSNDFFTCDEREILDITSDLTIVRGRIVHQK
ncbi:MAG: amidohydrolase [Firmicutes bacterium]|nr:amidohydrolase [Bacillota bacterium]